MTERPKTPAFRMTSPSECHLDGVSDRRYQKLRSVCGLCLITAWLCLVACVGAMGIGSTAPGFVPGTGRWHGIAVLIWGLFYRGQIVAFMLFLTTPLAFVCRISNATGWTYALGLLAGALFSSSWPFMVFLSTGSTNSAMSLSWLLWTLTFYFSSAAFMLPVLYDRYFADPD